MKRFSIVVAALLLLCSCGPQSYVMNLELRNPSPSGLDLDGKTMAVVYLENGSERDSLFNNCFADGLASSLEKEYFQGENSVAVYSAFVSGDENYLGRDSLLSLVMSLDRDVVFVVDAPMFGSTDGSKMLCSTSVSVYDSMDPSDKLRLARESGYVSFDDFQRLPYEAEAMGKSSSRAFLNTWKSESVSLVYFENMNDSWVTAIYLALDMEWADAREIWMELSTSKDLVQASCAQYNVAVACYIMRQYDLAIEWLDLSDRNQTLSLSSDLRKRIVEKMDK